MHEFRTNAFDLVLDGGTETTYPELRNLISIAFHVPNGTEGAGGNWISGGMFAILVVPLAQAIKILRPRHALQISCKPVPGLGEYTAYSIEMVKNVQHPTVRINLVSLHEASGGRFRSKVL